MREVFGSNFPIGIAPLVEHMTAESPRPLLEWFERIERENDDGDLTINYHLEADYNLHTVRALHQAVNRVAGGAGDPSSD